VSSFDALPGWIEKRDCYRHDGLYGLTRELTVGLAEGVGTTLEDVPANVMVVYFVLQNNDHQTVRGAGVARCSSDTATTDLEIVIRP